MSFISEKEFNKLQIISEEAMTLFGTELFNKPVISTDASDEELFEELINLEQNADNKAQKTLLTSISQLSQPVKLELLQL